MKANLKKRLEQLERLLDAGGTDELNDIPTELKQSFLDFVRRDEEYASEARRAAILHASGDEETASAIRNDAITAMRQRVFHHFGDDVANRIFTWLEK